MLISKFFSHIVCLINSITLFLNDGSEEFTFFIVLRFKKNKKKIRACLCTSMENADFFLFNTPHQNTAKKGNAFLCSCGKISSFFVLFIMEKRAHTKRGKFAPLKSSQIFHTFLRKRGSTNAPLRLFAEGAQ